ncbi:MAG TPA: hypothetical protein VFX89_00265 [Gammaproteobacteria bacterium]|nr:hypothetical protein [Gammaproteobacteria bacterium]
MNEVQASHEEIVASTLLVGDHRFRELAAVGDRLAELLVDSLELGLRRFAKRDGLRDQPVELFKIGRAWHRVPLQ